MYAQKFYVLETFPFSIAICALNDDQVHYGVMTEVFSGLPPNVVLLVGLVAVGCIY